VKVLSIARARAIRLLRLSDMNPHGKYIYPLLAATAEKYRFLKYTQPIELDPKDPTKPILFSSGRFQNRSEEEIEVELQLFQDGLVADTRSSTDDSDMFIDELLEWAIAEFGLVPSPTVSRIYLNELWVHTDKPLTLLNPKLQNLINHINSLYNEYSSKPLVFDLAAVGIWNDRTVAPNNFFSPFKFEKAEMARFEENRYYSIAPLRTSDHITILDELEQILAE
jgi:hypothetical protein